MKNLLVGLVGPMGAGKDTLVETHSKWIPTLRGAFADKVKAALSVIYDIPVSVFHDPVLKWQPHPNLPEGMTVRVAMQLFGTQVGRAIDPDVWLRAIERWVHQHAYEVSHPFANVRFITDVRFPNEVTLIRKLGGFMVYVERPEAEALLAQHVADGTCHDSELHCLDFYKDPEIIKFKNVYASDTSEYAASLTAVMRHVRRLANGKPSVLKEPEPLPSGSWLPAGVTKHILFYRQEESLP